MNGKAISMTRAELLPLLRRTVEIDYFHQHRHLPGSLTALPIIAEIYRDFDETKDVFILSKGHGCAALYAVLESRGKKPDCAKVHPERDVENGITITSGSLGHGLPVAAGIAYAKKLRSEPGNVHVLVGDGECQEGTTWESLLIISRLFLGANLTVHIDLNAYQGGAKILYNTSKSPWGHWGMWAFFIYHHPRPDLQVSLFPLPRTKSVHLVTEAEFYAAMEELK